MKPSLVTYASVVLVAAAGYQTFDLFTAVPSAQPSGYLNLALGERIEAEVESADRKALSLSDISPGHCRLVLVVSPSCSASRNAARSWNQAAANSHENRELLDGWRVIWVSLGDSLAAHSTFAKDETGPLWRASSDVALSDELGLRAVPAHVVLDRNGEILAGQVGVRLLPYEAYRNDCSIAEQPSI